jgi:hypothetical protein
MVSGSWGSWHDEIRSEELLDLPLRLKTARDPEVLRIIAAVDRLPRLSSQHSSLLLASGASAAVEAVFGALDTAVADLFGLTPEERDLVDDFWLRQSSGASTSVTCLSPTYGTAAELPNGDGELRAYISAFLDAWNPKLAPTGELSWQVWADARSRVLATVFETRGRDGATEMSQEPWQAVLERLGASMSRQRSRTLLSYGMVRAVSDTSIVIVKRDERRMWTASAARDDAEAATAQVMALRME